MTEPTLISQGVNLLLYGMGVVFVFLSLLVLVTGAMSALVQRFAPQANNSDPQSIDRRHVAAITAALHRHRNRNEIQ
ncbi:MAG: OadG family protein [Pseudomonadota bacterium]